MVDTEDIQQWKLLLMTDILKATSTLWIAFERLIFEIWVCNDEILTIYRDGSRIRSELTAFISQINPIILQINIKCQTKGSFDKSEILLLF